MGSDTESVGRSGRRSHWSLDDALEMDLNVTPIVEEGSDSTDDGVSEASGDAEPPRLRNLVSTHFSSDP